MAARAVIGQRTFTSQTPGASDVLVGAVSGLAYANGKLIAVDDNRVSATPQNNRVLIFDNVDGFLPSPTAELPVDDSERCRVCVGRASIVLGQTDFGQTSLGLNRSQFNHPTAIATDGTVLALADTDNNRVLLWLTFPTRNNQPADVVLGQPDFTTSRANEGGASPTQRGMRGPQGVWVGGGRLYVADTLNSRIMVWRSIPRSNFAPADFVLGQPNFTTATIQDLNPANFNPQPSSMLNPVSVTSDGARLFVSDLGYNRVLIWNSIPDAMAAPADVAVGQPDLRSGIANNTQNLCPEDRTTNEDGETVYPPACLASLDFPRYALSDGKRLFIADGGNDRILVFNNIPTQSGQNADLILGQIASRLNQVSDSANPGGRASADSVAAPMALATDGTNLFVSDPFRRRILVFTPGEVAVPYTGVRNMFSRDIFSVGTISFAGAIKTDDEITIKISQEEHGEKEYKYKIVEGDTFEDVVNKLVELINAGEGDPNVRATPNLPLLQIVLTARYSGSAGDTINFTVTRNDNATIEVTTSGATLDGGEDAAKIAPGTLVTILGENLSDHTESAPPGADPLPRELGGVQVYFDGLRAPLLSVSPGEIRAQVPWDVNDSNSITAWVRIRRDNGNIVNTAAVAVPVVPFNPGILAVEGTIDPRPAIATHFSSRATGTVSVDGSVQAGDVAKIVIEDREYSYTVKEGDTLAIIRDALIAAINANPEEKVEAFEAGVFTRVRLRAKVDGPAGNGIAISTRTNDGAQVILTATNSALCCANRAGAPITEANPAVPGETIVVLGTGLGIVEPDEAKFALGTGFTYKGPVLNRPNEFVSSLAGGRTANVLYSGAAQGLVGVYEVHLELNSDLPTNPLTQLWIAQDVNVSNTVAIPVVNPRDLAADVPASDALPARSGRGTAIRSASGSGQNAAGQNRRVMHGPSGR